MPPLVAPGHRTQQFVPDGRRILAAPRDIVAAWRAHTRLIPAQYALGTAQHETDFTLNEVDVETSGYVSKGIFQLADSDAVEAGLAHANLLDLADATRVFAVLCEKRLGALAAAVQSNVDALPPDVWAYLAIAHNQGLHAALETLHRYGMSWAAYKTRNPSLKSIASYGDDVISGGHRWTADLEAPAPLVG